MGAAALALALILYVLGVRRLRRRGGHWPVSRTLFFVLLGLLPYAVIEFGFLGTYSEELRYAFTTRIALLLFVVPAGIAAGRPIQLLRETLNDPGLDRLDRVLRSRILRLFGNAMFATVFAALVFALLLTPIAWLLRSSPAADAALGVVVPLVGLVMVLPIAENGESRTAFFITVEALLAFVEMLIDAIPGIVMRLSATVLDKAPAFAAAGPWWPSPLRDQQLSGDILWFIAEAADVPILVVLFVRWSRSDRREAKSFDDLSDEEYESLARAHLEGRGAGSDAQHEGAVPPDARGDDPARRDLVRDDAARGDADR